MDHRIVFIAVGVALVVIGYVVVMRIFYREHYENRYPRPVSWATYAAINLREVVELGANRSDAGAKALTEPVPQPARIIERRDLDHRGDPLRRRQG